MRRVLVTPFLCALSLVAATVTARPFQDDCACRAALDELVAKVEANYAGYRLGVRGRRDAEYARHVAALRRRAAGFSPDECVDVLQELVRYFRDGHLFVGTWPRLTGEEAERLARAAETTDLREPSVMRYLDARPGRLDPIEGVWYAKEGYRVGIVRDPKRGRRDFVAVMLSDSVERWRPGQVKAEFRKLADGSYDATYYAEDHSRRRPGVYERGRRGGAAIRRGLLLHMPPVTWGKAHPLGPGERGLLDPEDPRRPTLRVADPSTVVVSVPSHSPEYAPVLGELVEANRERIGRADTLVVDLRGNEGGSAGTTRVLMPFLVTPAKRPARYWRGGRVVVLSSPDTVAYFERAVGQGWVEPSFVERLRASPGKLVPFGDDEPAAADARKDVATARPRDVAILIDGAVVSAGEAFVLSAMRNTKVTLFGENTGGVLDYQSVQIVGLKACGARGFGLGYPVMAASDRLPLGGVNATGIPPDVRIPPGVQDPVAFVIAHYARKARGR